MQLRLHHCHVRIGWIYLCLEHCEEKNRKEKDSLNSVSEIEQEINNSFELMNIDPLPMKTCYTFNPLIVGTHFMQLHVFSELKFKLNTITVEIIMLQHQRHG